MEKIVANAYNNYHFHSVSTQNHRTVYQLSSPAGHGTMECREVLPGIQISYNCLNMENCFQNIRNTRHTWQIDFCHKGCYEWEVNKNTRLFLGEGMTSVMALNKIRFKSSRIPLRYFEGISIFLEPERVQPVLDREFSGSHIQLMHLESALCLSDRPFLLRPLTETRQIFQDINRARTEKDPAYLWLKTVELLLLLSQLHLPGAEYLRSFSAETEKGTREIYEYLRIHPLCDLSLRDLCGAFHVSESSVQRCFKYITGKSVGVFRKEKRMEEASRFLQSGMTVGETAAHVGYSNHSKFTEAFKSVFHQTPSSYQGLGS